MSTVDAVTTGHGPVVTLSAAAALSTVADALRDAGVSLGCTEADTIGRALVAAGLADQAVTMLVGHAGGDHYGDGDGGGHGEIARAIDAGSGAADAARRYLVRGVTVVAYRYRDAGGFQEHTSLTLAGLITPAQHDAVAGHTFGDGLYFYPAEVGMLDPRAAFLEVASLGKHDPLHCELTGITTHPDAGAPDGTETVGAWVSRFVAHQWAGHG